MSSFGRHGDDDRLSFADSSDDDDEDLEVLPPSSSSTASAIKATSRNNNKGRPRLSASGLGEKDPIALLDDDESENDDDDDRPLMERVMARPSAAARTFSSPAVRNSQQATTTTSATALRVVPQAKFAATAAATATNFDSSSSEDSASSEDTIHRKIKALNSRTLNLPTQNRKPAQKKKKTTTTTALSQQSMSLLSQASSSSSTTIVCSSQPSSSQPTKPKRARPVAATATTLLERQAHRLQQQEQRDQAKRVKQQAKDAIQRARLAKKQVEQAEKRRKQDLRDQARQQKGHYAVQEIVVLLDSTLYRHAELTIVDELQVEQKYMVVEHASMLGCKTIQFIRQDYTTTTTTSSSSQQGSGGGGGAQGALDALRAGNHQGYEHLPVVGVVFDTAMDFINLLERDQKEEDDYPKLQEWLQSFECGWRAAWKCSPKTQPRILLYLYKVTQTLEQLWIDYKRNKHPAYMAPPSDEELKDAMAWLLIQFQVECVECRELDQLQMEMNRLTCKLSDIQYRKTYSELDISQKLAPLCSADASLYDQAMDCWLRQVQQMPRVSFNMARALVEHYPTAHSLWSTYQDSTLTQEDKRMLLVDCFGDGKCQAKLSEHFYQFMTSENPNDLLI